jgi:hypothetical protein
MPRHLRHTAAQSTKPNFAPWPRAPQASLDKHSTGLGTLMAYMIAGMAGFSVIRASVSHVLFESLPGTPWCDIVVQASHTDASQPIAAHPH